MTLAPKGKRTSQEGGISNYAKKLGLKLNACQGIIRLEKVFFEAISEVIVVMCHVKCVQYK